MPRSASPGGRRDAFLRPVPQELSSRGPSCFADTIIVVIGAPMYNFTISTQLKSWIDRVIVAGKTFQYGANGPESLLAPGKKVFLASTRGGAYGEGSPAAFLEHHESYLRGALGFIGLTDVTVVRAEGLAMGDDAKAAAISQAKGQIAAFA